MTFENKITKQNTLNFNFHDDFDDIKVWMLLLQSNETDPKLYDGWTFPSDSVMDNFYYNQNTTRLI